MVRQAKSDWPQNRREKHGVENLRLYTGSVWDILLLLSSGPDIRIAYKKAFIWQIFLKSRVTIKGSFDKRPHPPIVAGQGSTNDAKHVSGASVAEI